MTILELLEYLDGDGIIFEDEELARKALYKMNLSLDTWIETEDE